MKNLIFAVLFLFIAIIHSANAQIRFGIKAGGNYSNMEGDWNKLPGPLDTLTQYQALFGQFATLLDQPSDNIFKVDARGKFGAHAGFFFNIPLAEKFSLQPEILFSMKGANFDNTIQLSGDSTSYVIVPVPSPDTTNTLYFEGDAKVNYDIKYSLNYIEIPLLAQYKFNNGLTISAGPYIGFLIAAKFQYDITATVDVYGTNTDHNNNTTETIIDTTITIFSEEIDKSKDDLNSIEVGFAVGVGYEFPFGLGIHARYVRGLTEVFKDKVDAGFHNSVIQLGVSYKIFDNLFKPD